MYCCSGLYAHVTRIIIWDRSASRKVLLLWNHFFFFRIIYHVLYIAMLWSVVQLRRGQLRMVAYVVGSYWWCDQPSVLARHNHMLHCPPVPTVIDDLYRPTPVRSLFRVVQCFWNHLTRHDYRKSRKFQQPTNIPQENQWRGAQQLSHVHSKYILQTTKWWNKLWMRGNYFLRMVWTDNL